MLSEGGHPIREVASPNLRNEGASLFGIKKQPTAIHDEINKIQKRTLLGKY